MTLTLLATGPLLANKDNRTLSGLLLPFNVAGQTNLGRLTASAESVLDLAELVPLNVQHRREDVVGKAVSIETAPEGLRATFAVLATPAGDAALLEAAEGLRACLSVEVDPIVTRSGRIVSGTVTGAALVVEGAFPGAKLAAEAAGPVPDMGDGAEPQVTSPEVVIDGEKLENVTDVSVSDDKIEIQTSNETEHENEAAALAASKKGTEMANATVTNPALVASQPEPVTETKLYATLANGYRTGNTGSRLEAALSDVVPANILGIEQPQYVGQIWAGQPYERRIIPLFDHSDLNSFNIQGWDWGTKPAVGLYTGNKTDIPSAGITTVAKSGTIQRIAGGHDIDRKFKDFGSEEFWAAYFSAMAESYAKVSDTYIRDQVVASIGAGAQRVHLLTGVAPAGVPTAIWQIIEGCVKMLDDLNTLPNFAIVTSDLWKQIFYTKQNDVLAFINLSLGLKEGSMDGFKIVPVPAGSLTNGGWVGKTIVGHKSAFNVYELPGSPIRVSAEDIARGGVDEALFGYVGFMAENAKGLISFDAPAAS